MKQLLKNRTIIGLLCIILALIICFGLAPLVAGSTAKQIQISRVSKEIPKNTKITSEMLENVKVGAYNLPDNVIRNRNDIVGQYSKIEMLPGDYVLSSKLSPTPLGTDEYLTRLDGKKQAISITIKTFAAGLSGKLETGDIVTLIASDYGDLKQTIIPPDLQYVKVLAATTTSGEDNDSTARETETKGSNTKQDMPSTLTLLVSPDQAKTLVDCESHGTLHASLVFRGDSKTSQKFLDMQDQYLAKQQEDTGNE